MMLPVSAQRKSSLQDWVTLGLSEAAANQSHRSISIVVGQETPHQWCMSSNQLV
jgi:hypothetical protein